MTRDAKLRVATFWLLAISSLFLGGCNMGGSGNSGGMIRAVSKNGGSATTLASGLGGVNQIGSDGADIYWTEYNLGAKLDPLRRWQRQVAA